MKFWQAKAKSVSQAKELNELLGTSNVGEQIAIVKKLQRLTFVITIHYDGRDGHLAISALGGRGKPMSEDNALHILDMARLQILESGRNQRKEKAT